MVRPQRQGDLFQPDVGFCRTCNSKNRRFALLGGQRKRLCLECEAPATIHEQTTFYDLAPHRASIHEQAPEGGDNLVQLCAAWGMAIATSLPRPRRQVPAGEACWPGVHVLGTVHKDPALVLRHTGAMEAYQDELFFLVVVSMEEWLVRIPGAITWGELGGLQCGHKHQHWGGREITFPFSCWYVHEAGLRPWSSGLLSDLVRVYRTYQKKGD